VLQSSQEEKQRKKERQMKDAPMIPNFEITKWKSIENHPRYRGFATIAFDFGLQAHSLALAHDNCIHFPKAVEIRKGRPVEYSDGSYKRNQTVNFNMDNIEALTEFTNMFLDKLEDYLGVRIKGEADYSVLLDGSRGHR
jgi:hypothetical protein